MGPGNDSMAIFPICPDYGPKPAGSGYYPADMTREEFDALEDPEKTSLYTLINRNQEGSLEVIPYHEAYASQVEKAAELC